MVESTIYTAISCIAFSSILIFLFITAFSNLVLLFKVSYKLLVVLIVIVLLRLFLPIEIVSFTKPINSVSIYPYLIKIFNKTLFVFSGVHITLIHTLMFVWLFGTAISLYKFFYSYNFLRKNTLVLPGTMDKGVLNTLEELMTEHNFNFKVKLVISKYIPFPSEFGFFEQTILLPSLNYSRDELKCILLHELVHYNSKTNWVKLVFSIVKSIFWWNPVFYLLYDYMNTIVEVYVDTHVTKNMDHDEKSNYMSYLLNVWKADASTANPGIAVLNSFIGYSDKKILRKRFTAVSSFKEKGNPFVQTFVLVAFVAIQILTYTFVLQPAYAPIESSYFENESGSGYIIDGSTSYIIAENGLYFLFTENENLVEITQSQYETYVECGFKIIYK